MLIFRRPWTRQPQVPARINPEAGLRPEFLLLGGQQIELATGRPWTQAGGSMVPRNSMRAFDPGGTASALTRAGTTTAAQTKITFVAVVSRIGSNAFAEIMSTSNDGGSFRLVYEADGVTVGITKGGVFGFNGITPAGSTPLVLIASHDQTSGDYWIMSRELLTGVELLLTQNNTAASSASNGTSSITRLGGANAFQDSIFFGLAAFQYKPQAWGRRYLANPWALLQPQPARIWVPVTASAASIVGPLVTSRHLASNGPLISGRLAA